ncbi:phage tail protein [Streptomyces shenzhenensis]
MKAASEKPAKPTVSAKSANPAPERTPTPTPTPEEVPVPTPAGRGLTPRSLQRLQSAAGNAAVSRLVAQRYAAPVKPPASQAPGMRRVNADIAAKKQKLATHKAATAESRSAQGAAKAPPDDKQAQGKAANAEKMNAAEPGEFDKAAFIAAVDDAIDAQAPKNLDEADKFADSGKADEIKGAVDGKVTEGKESSAQDIETTTTAAPDTSQAKEKQVTPMTPDRPPANPGAPDAADAVPQQQPPEVTDFSEGPRRTDQQMAEADVTEEQLARSNEPQFTEALGEKKKAEQHSATAPGQARAAEKQQLATAKAGAAAAGATAMAALTAKRGAAGREVDGGKGETKSKDEQKREEVTAKLQRVFDATQKDVKEILDGLDVKVDRQFEEGEKRARDAFNTDQKRRMKEYKDKRYGGFFGPAKWAKDKLMGMPEEANQLFQESRKLYVRLMQGVISSIADMIGRELGRAKARITRGRTDLKAEVDKLPADLRQFGEEAAQDFAAKFDDLEADVNDKSQELVQSLAQKYTQALNAVDEEIKKLQEANKGLVQKAVDAVVSVVQTIKELKDLLMGVLAKAASAITKIIKDPIGFLGNLVRSVGAGLQQFASNIATHLQSGLVSWLLGTSVKAGIEIPARFDLKGIIQIIASLLGLTWANIRARITRKGVPDQAMTEVEQSVPVAKALATEGPAGATKEIQAEVGDVKSTILEELKSYLIPTVIVAGITWILSLLNPASAFIRAVKAIIDIVTFIVTQGAQIVEFVNAVLDAVIAIASGGSAGVPKTIETALAASIPLLIGLLASLLGIGGLANKIRQTFQKVSRPVNRAIDKIVDKIAQFGKRVWSKTKKKEQEKKPHGQAKEGERDEMVRLPKARFRNKAGEGHLLAFSENKSGAKLLLHSEPRDVHEFLNDTWPAAIKDIEESSDRELQERAHESAVNRYAEVKTAQSALDNSTGAARQQNLTDLVKKLSRLSDALADHDPSSSAPIPAPVLPPFVDNVRAEKFTAHYINNKSKGTPSSAHDGNLRGWDYVDSASLNKGSNRTAWVKMHLLPDFLGGHATDSNLVPARGFTNNPLFLHAAENPAKVALRGGGEKIIWYRIKDLTFYKSPGGEFPDDAFPHSLGVEWGGYERRLGKWEEKGASGSFSDDQDPPTVARLRINVEGATAVATWLGLPKKSQIAQSVKDGRPYAGITDLTVRFPSLASKFSDLESKGLIRWD